MINHIKLKDLKSTEGDELKIKKLIQAAIIEKDINNGERGPSNYWFKYNGFEIAFTDSSGTPNHPGIAMFEITNNNWSFTVQGKTVTIGSDISVLGNVIFHFIINYIFSVAITYTNMLFFTCYQTDVCLL